MNGMGVVGAKEYTKQPPERQQHPDQLPTQSYAVVSWLLETFD
jgi:hypothetical protein